MVKLTKEMCEKIGEVIGKENAIWNDSRKSCSLNLRGSDLRGSNLSRSDLRFSDLSYSDLSNSNMMGSDLSYGDLRESFLFASDLTKALICDVKTHDSKLKNALDDYCKRMI